MKTTKRTTIKLLAAALLATACSSDDALTDGGKNPTAQKSPTLKVETEYESESTRMVLDLGTRRNAFEQGDKVAVWGASAGTGTASTSGAAEYTVGTDLVSITKSAGTDVEGTAYYGVYPYGAQEGGTAVSAEGGHAYASVLYAENSTNHNLIFTEEEIQKDFPNIMVGQTENGGSIIFFKNTGYLAKVRVDNQTEKPIQSVVLATTGGYIRGVKAKADCATGQIASLQADTKPYTYAGRNINIAVGDTLTLYFLLPAAGDTYKLNFKAFAETLENAVEYGSGGTCSLRAGVQPLRSVTSKDNISPARSSIITLGDLGIYQPHVTQPAGYKLVWQQEFNAAKLPDGRATLVDESEWNYDLTYRNSELQTYISGVQGNDTCVKVADGTLKLVAKKTAWGSVVSGSIYSKRTWTYGCFEARLKLPPGTGTWPAFWMMPTDQSAGWPACGEIDIMEEVGYPYKPLYAYLGLPHGTNHCHSSLHTGKYHHNGANNMTPCTACQDVPTAQTAFHVYTLEWTETFINFYIDGVPITNDGTNGTYFPYTETGTEDAWPFNKPFYVMLNLAWGGTWGGAYANVPAFLGGVAVDESCLPATYEIDYVRVFQK